MTRRAFTLVELMVAVIVLLAVIVATSKIFSTASKVTSMGEATAAVVQQAGVIEEQLRRDVAAVTQDGYIAIQCVAVRNDVNRVITGVDTAPLLNAELEEFAVIRADTIVFFTAGGEITMRWSGPNDTAAFGGNQQSRAARVYYGHGVQLPELGNDPAGSGAGQVKPIIQGVAPVNIRPQQLVPWFWRDPSAASFPQVRWRSGTSTHASAGMPRISPNQPEAREWVLCRKAMLLADDGGRVLYYPDPDPSKLAQAAASTGPGPSSAPNVFGDASNTAPTGADSAFMYMENRGRSFTPWSTNVIPSPTMQSGWVDIAASEMDEVRRFIAPTLPLTNPVPVPTSPPNVELASFSTPWFANPNATAEPYFMAPFGWPVGSLAWPWGSAVMGAHLQAGTVESYSNQRDRIIRGTFGPVNSNTALTTGSTFSNNLGMLAWPRAEKKVPNSDRRSEILTSPVLVNNCSHFQIDWTWDRGTGKQTDLTGAPIAARFFLDNTNVNDGLGIDQTALVMRGYEPDAGPWNSDPMVLDFTRVPRPQPWFGYPDSGDGDENNLDADLNNPGKVIPRPNQRMGVTLAQRASAMPQFAQIVGSANQTNSHMRMVARSIEGIDGSAQLPCITTPFGADVPVRIYTAVFGFNQENAYLVTPDGLRVLRDDYTPWPSQLRFTLTLHDPRLVLERGREFQFVLDLPRRKK